MKQGQIDVVIPLSEIEETPEDCQGVDELVFLAEYFDEDDTNDVPGSRDVQYTFLYAVDKKGRRIRPTPDFVYDLTNCKSVDDIIQEEVQNHIDG